MYIELWFCFERVYTLFSSFLNCEPAESIFDLQGVGLSMGITATKLKINYGASKTQDPRFTTAENAYTVVRKSSTFQHRQKSSQGNLNKYSCSVTLDDGNDRFKIKLVTTGPSDAPGDDSLRWLEQSLYTCSHAAHLVRISIKHAYHRLWGLDWRRCGLFWCW